jgi:putative membrane protein
MIKQTTMSIGATLLICGTIVNAQTPNQTNQKTTRQEATSAANSGQTADQAFVHEAAMGGMAEVELGKLAAAKATNSKVKSFAERMVTDHGKANDELKNLASSKHVTLPAAVDAKHQAAHDRLAKLSGAAFDRAYVRDMVTDHEKDVAAFRRESQSGKDPDVKMWAAKTLPTLQDHLKMIQELQKDVVSSTATN